MCRLLLILVVAGTCAAFVAAQPVAPKLLLAFASTRERRDPPYPKIYFYQHDGVANGKLLRAIDTISKGVNSSRADMHPSLSGDGRYCAFSAQLGILDGARIAFWDRADNKQLDLPSIQESPKIHQMGASLSGDGKLVAYSAWARPGSSQRIFMALSFRSCESIHLITGYQPYQRLSTAMDCRGPGQQG